MRWRLMILGFILAAGALAQAPTEHDYSADETLLRNQGLPTKGDGLLRVLRDRTPSKEILAQFNKHVGRLRAAPFAERKQATDDLLKMGAVVRPLLEKTLVESSVDLETLRRLRHVLEHFPADKDFATMSAAARLIQRDRTPGSLQILLDFVPYATNEFTRQDVQRAINAAAFEDKKPSPLLLTALKDPEGSRRAAAVEALVRGLGGDATKEIEAHFKDEHPLVRFQLGVALVEKNDPAGVPLLIKALSDSPAERVETALDLLYRIAGEKAPSEPYRGKANAPQFTAAWQKWYDAQKEKLDLPKLMARTELGFTVITTTGLKANVKNRIFEVGPDKTVRWEFDGPRTPLDVQVIGPNRLLLCEYSDRRVTERDFKGNVLWQHAVNLPIACQRLPNGYTFIATRQQLLIVDRDGKEQFSHAFQGAPGNLSAAQRLRNGQFLVVTTAGRCMLLDPQGRELKGFQMGPVYSLGGAVEMLPNGRILAALYTQGQVAEFDWNGHQKWTAKVTGRPVAATRLANGHTLITCSLDYRIVELDAQGREVWSYNPEGRPYRARRR